MCDDYTNHLLECILDRLESDEYESGGYYTLGGAVGTYQLRSPFNTECEYMVIGAYSAATPATSVVGEAVRTVFSNNSTSNANFTSTDLAVGDLTLLDIDIVFTSFTGGASPTITYNINRKDAQGNYNLVWSSGSKSAAFSTFLSIGLGAAAGSAPAANDATVGLDFGDIIQVQWTITGGPTSITQTTSIKGKGPIVTSIAQQGVVIVSNNNAGLAAFTLGTSLGLVSAGGDMNNAFEGIVLPTSSAVNALIAVDHWSPLGRGASLFVYVSGASSYALIALRRKIDRYIPQMERMYPKTHSSPQSRRALRQLPAASNFAAGFESQYPDLSGSQGKEHIPYRHEQVNEQDDTRNIGNAIKRVTRYGR